MKEVFGVAVALEQFSDEERETALVATGVPTVAAKHLTAVDATTRNGAFDGVTDVVEHLTGVRPRSFREFLIENRDGLLEAAKSAGKWNLRYFPRGVDSGWNVDLCRVRQRSYRTSNAKSAYKK